MASRAFAKRNATSSDIPSSIKKGRSAYTYNNHQYDHDDGNVIGGIEITPFSKASKRTLDERKIVTAKKNRHLMYLAHLHQLNTSFAEWAKKQHEELKENIGIGADKSERPSRFFVAEAKQYIAYAEELERIYDRKDCEVLIFGMGDCGQLGLSEDDLEAKRPTHVKNLPENVTVLACGGLHNAVVSKEGDVYTWGCNDDGALGLIDKNNQINTSFLPKKVNRICQNLSNFDNPPPNETIKWVATGDSHTLALSYSGNVYMWGAYKDKEGRSWRDIPPSGWPEYHYKNEEHKDLPPRGIQKFPTPVSLMKDRKVEMVVCGSSFNAAVLDDRSLVTWGIGECGELGRPSKAIRRPDGSYDLDTIRQQYLTPMPPLWSSGSNHLVHSVACGAYHTLIITQGLRVATAGLNNYGQLGHGDTKNRDRFTFVEALDNSQVKAVEGGGHHSLCLAQNGRLIAFGRGDSGQLGITDGIPPVGYLEENPVEVLLPGDDGTREQPKDPVVQISCGTNHNLAITECGDVYTWGYGDMSALGHGKDKDEYRPMKLKLKDGWKTHQAAGGGQHSALLCTKD